MTRRYPPVFSVILFIVAVCIVVANPIAIFAPWISAAINGIVMIIGGIFSAVGYVYDKYAIFTIHVVIIALYGKQLFSKKAKAKYLEAINIANSYKQNDYSDTCDDYDTYCESHSKIIDILTPLYALSLLTLTIIILNIVFPNFYQYTILQGCGNILTNETEAGVVLFGSLLLTPVIIMLPVMLGLLVATFKADGMLDTE
jgi:hypothetical protein